LLEVGEQTQKKYEKQSKETSHEFLMKGIEIANDSDLKYKTSKNQRLLVELCLMQLASITFSTEKKNNDPFIIPASYFRAKSISPITIEKPEKVDSQKKSETESILIEVTTVPNEIEQEVQEFETPAIVEKRPEIILKSEKKRVSGLSLSSIKKKKEHHIRQMEVVIDQNDLPKEDFTEEEMQHEWNSFVSRLQKKGKHNLASILSIDEPKLKKNTIHLEFPNSTNKVEVERQQYELLSHLRKQLNNFDIQLSITVNEEKEKQYAYTSKEKYQKLMEKNPNLETLRKTFDLDI